MKGLLSVCFVLIAGLAFAAEPRLALRVSTPCDASCECGCQEAGPCLCGQEASKNPKKLAKCGCTDDLSCGCLTGDADCDCPKPAKQAKRSARTWNCGDGGPKWTWSDKGKCWRRTVCNASGCSLESCRPGQVPKSMRVRPVQVAFGGCSSGG